MRRLFGVALLCACALLTGCSGDGGGAVAPSGTAPPAAAGASDEVAEYREAFTASVEAYQSRVGGIQQEGQQALDSGSEDAVLEVYGSLRDASEEAADELEDLEPPASLREQHATLVQQLRRQRDALDDVIAAARARDEAALTQGLTTLAELLVDVATTQQAIDQELARAP